MGFMDWRADMSVGVPEIDDDHRVLIGVINELAENRGRDDRLEVLRGCFSHLTNYAEFHFAREESMLRAAGFDGLEKHQDEHRAFEAELKELGSRLEGQLESGAEAVNAKLLTYLRGWLQHHILVVDKAYQPLVEDNQAAREAASRFKPSHHWWGR